MKEHRNRHRNRYYDRRRFLHLALATTLTPILAKPAASAAGTTTTTTSASTRPPDKIPDNITWHDVRDWGLEGRGYNDTENYFDRLPARAKGVVREEVWTLSRNSTGMSTRFISDTDAIYIRYEVTSATLALSHMPASAVSGLDAYAQPDDAAGAGWRWLHSHLPGAPSFQGGFITKLAPERRRYQINLPLYNGVKSLAIGIPKSSAFEPIPPRKDKPILFYGTSITQGASASRPGMSFVNILGRRLDRPILNFGFSGNGRMEVEVARYLAELDPAVFVLDCLANMGTVPITARTEAVVKLLREAHRDTPILIVEERDWPDSAFLPHRAENHARRCADLRAAYDHLIAAGMTKLHYRAGADLIGNDGEGTVDGSHPNDLGMMRYADALEGDLRRILS